MVSDDAGPSGPSEPVNPPELQESEVMFAKGLECSKVSATKQD
jgi:hypothetical protein